MRTTKSSAQSVFKSFFTTYTQENRQAHKPLYLGKHAKYIWAAIFLSIVISYNSCGIHHARLMDKKGVEQIIVTVPPPDSKLMEAPQKIIYLTFDDGPNRGTTNVMGVLNQANIPATFFLVGSHIHGSNKQWSEYQRILQNPTFEAANHTYYHAKNRYAHFYKNPQVALEDFRMMRDSLPLNCPVGRTPGCNTWRTPHISVDVDRRSNKAANLLQTNGYTLVGWDVEWKVNKQFKLKKNPGELAQEIRQHFEQRLTKTDDHLVLLLHDQHFADSTNIKSLEELIVELKGEYTFRKVSEYPCL